MLEEKKEEIFNNAAKSAQESVKFRFIASQIAETEKIDVDQRADRPAPGLFGAARRRHVLEKMIERVRKKQRFWTSSAASCMRQAVLDFLLKEAKFE